MQKSFFVVIEVGLKEVVFVIPDDDFDSSNLFGWVKGVTHFEVPLSSCLASLTIIKGESKYVDIFPRDLYDFQISELFPAFLGDFFHVRKIYCCFYILLLIQSDYMLALYNTVKHHQL